MIEQTLYSLLSAAPAVTSLTGQRIYPLQRPQGDTLPALVYQRVATTPVTSLSGDTGIDAVRLQIDCLAATYVQVKALADASRAAIVGGLRAITEMQLDLYDDETRTFRVTMDFRVWQK